MYLRRMFLQILGGVFYIYLLGLVAVCYYSKLFLVAFMPSFYVIVSGLLTSPTII